jgi:hypothetical protein
MKELLRLFVSKIRVNTEKVIVSYRFELNGAFAERTTM